MKEDVINYLESLKDQSSRPATKAAAEPNEAVAASKQPIFSSPISTVIGENRVEPIRGIRKAMVKSMTAALKVCITSLCVEDAFFLLFFCESFASSTRVDPNSRSKLFAYFCRSLFLCIFACSRFHTLATATR